MATQGRRTNFTFLVLQELTLQKHIVSKMSLPTVSTPAGCLSRTPRLSSNGWVGTELIHLVLFQIINIFPKLFGPPMGPSLIAMNLADHLLKRTARVYTPNQI